MEFAMKIVCLLLGILVLLVGCHTPSVTRGTEDPSIDRRAISTGVDMADWRHAVAMQVQAMEKSPFFASARTGDKKTVVVSDFPNASASHIDTGFLREMMEEELMNMGYFRLLEDKKRGELLKTLTIQNQMTELFDASTVAEKGRQLGVQYFVQGQVLGSKERGHDVIRSQYLIVVEVVDVSTAEKVFKKTVPVSKQLE